MTAGQIAQTILGGLAIGSIYSLIALGVSMIIRATDILHFAQGDVMMIGSLSALSASMAHELPLPVMLACGMAGGSLAAVAAEVLVYRGLRRLRVPAVNVVIATLGVSIILQNIARLTWGSEPLAYPPLFAARSIAVGGVAFSPQLIWIVGLGGGIALGLLLFFRYARLGLAMQAAAQDPAAAQLMGISINQTTTCTFAIAGAMAGAAGVLLGSLFFASFNMGFLAGIKAFVAATLGGLGSTVGAVAGGLLFGLVETLAGRVVSTSYKDAVGMVVLIAILVGAPNGLFGRRGRRV